MRVVPVECQIAASFACHSICSGRPAFVSRSITSGGVIVLHDVVCCKQQYPGLIKFMERALLNPKRSHYRELHFEVPRSWDALPAGVADRVRTRLHASIDQRPTYRRNALIHRKSTSLPCERVCNLTKQTPDPLANGYQWSLCQNIRVFQRVAEPPAAALDAVRSRESHG